MNVGEMLPQGALAALAKQLGIAPEQAERGAEALLPSIVGGMGDAAGGHAVPGATDLETLLTGLGGGGLADNVIGPEVTDVDKGNTILGQIFGSKDVSREVAGHASESSGLDPALLKRMLPILAMLVAGYMSKRSGEQQGGLGGILSSVLGSLAGSGTPRSGLPMPGATGGGLGDILGSILGGRR